MTAEEPTKMIAEEEKPLTKKISPGTGRGIKRTEMEMFSLFRVFSLFQFLFSKLLI